MSGDILFNPDIAEREKELRHLINKFVVCTEEKRQFLLETVDFMVEQFIRRRRESTSGKIPE